MYTTSYKYIHRGAGDNWVARFHPYATSRLWAVIIPSDGGLASWDIGNTISYDTTVGAYTAGNPHGCTNSSGIHTYNTTVTYTVIS